MKWRLEWNGIEVVWENLGITCFFDIIKHCLSSCTWKKTLAFACAWKFTPVCTCMHVCMRACSYVHAFVHACVYVCVHIRRNQDNIPKKCVGACRMKLTVSDKPLRHGFELLLLLVQSQRSLCYWVAPYTSPYRRVFSQQLSSAHRRRPSKETSSQCFDSLPTCCMQSTH